MNIISRAEWLGLDEQRRQHGGTAAIIDVDGVRFFTLTARDEGDAERINAAADKLVNEGRIFQENR